MATLTYTPNSNLRKRERTEREKIFKKAISERFGRYLRGIRENRKLSQEELADRAGINRTYIGSIETGSYTPSLYIVWKLSQALDLKAYQLLKDFE